jgi:hypothetical protein
MLGNIEISLNPLCLVVLKNILQDCYYINTCKNCFLYWGFILILGDWLIIYGFTSRSRIFHLYGDVTIAGEGLQKLGLCSALWAFEQGGIFIVPHLLWHGTSVFPVLSERPSHSVASYDTHGDAEDLHVF